jgi:hypothetical protein
MSEPIHMKRGMYIMAPESISAAHFINPSHQSVSMCIPPVIATQGLVKNVTATMNTHAKVEELLDMSSVQSVLYERKVGNYFFSKFLVNVCITENVMFQTSVNFHSIVFSNKI